MSIDEHEDEQSDHGARRIPTVACLMRARSRHLTSMTRKQRFAIAQTLRVAAVLVVAAAIGCGKTDQSGLTPQGSPAATDLPCDVEMVFASRCWACHGRMPAPDLPSLTSVAALMAPSRLDPAQSVGTVALARMQSTTIPMPPPPAAAATADEVAAICELDRGRISWRDRLRSDLYERPDLDGRN